MGLRRIFGLGVLLAGLAILGWLGWMYYGTTWVAHRREESVVATLREGWAANGGHTERSDRHSASIVRIPRFGYGYAVPLLDGTSADVLALGFGRLESTALPGAVGNLVIAGHRVTYGEPLRRMPELEPGDRILIDQADRTLVYVLDTGGAQLRIPYSDSWVTETRPSNPVPGGVQPPSDAGRRLLTVVTCAELFHTEDRLVAFGHLVAIRTSGPGRR